jgi:uncharacterized protein with HEPN domain
MPREADLVRVHHMLDAAREALSFCEGKTRGDLDGNRMLVRALVKSIEIVGEAASKVSADTRAEIPGVPWADIVAAEDLPPLVATLTRWIDEQQ